MSEIRIKRSELAAWWEQASLHEREAILAPGATDSAVRFATPGDMAMALDPMTVQTPALELVDHYLIQVRDAVAVMYERRALFARLVREGHEHQYASERATDEIPQRGITRLMISMPPQEGKSTRVSRYNPIWLLQQFPKLRIAIVSYDGTNATQFTQAARGDIELFNGTHENVDIGLRLMADDKAKSRWQITSGGGVYGIGIGGGLTGRPVDYMLIDDPVKDQKDADSKLMSENKWVWWQTVARPRLAPWSPVLAMMTRWAEDDLQGRFIKKQLEDEASGIADGDHWTVLNIPAEADHDPSRGESDPLGREPGEFLISARGRTKRDWINIKTDTSTRYWNAMYQGRPSAAQGTILLRGWWRRYDEPLWTSQPDGTYRVDGYELWQSWDFTFRDARSSDFVVGQLWAVKRAESFLVTQIRARLDFPASIDAMRRLTRLFPQTRRKLVEGKANGDAVISTLRREIPGIILVNPTASKTQRAEAISPYLRAGNILLPTRDVASLDPVLAFDVEDVIEEAASFPHGTHDDQVDAFTQFAQERYLTTAPARAISPDGRIPAVTVAAAARGATRRLSPVQERLARQARND